jgi:hypothetical protein
MKVLDITPRVKGALERDDLGIGKSPARRLFGKDNAGETTTCVT